VVANSWQQTPAGYHIVGEGMHARAEITDFWAMVFNPSSVDRILHVWVGSFLAGTFLVMSVSAWYILKGRHVELSKASFKIALSVAVVSAVLQLFIGHRSAHVVAAYQAMEGHFDSLQAADLYLFGWVDKKNQKTHGVSIPGGLSYMIHGNAETPVQGLRSFNKEDRPSAVNLVFQVYHIMIMIGMALIALTLYATYLLIRKKFFEKRWMLWVFVWAVLLPQVANQVGWYTAETGRQPWVVYGHLRTSEALSEAVKAEQVWFSLILFTVVYLLLFTLFVYLLNNKIKHGPYDDHDDEHRPQQKLMAGM
jgi:cytochrome bd ubiquinol oxidase subunit I